MYNLGIKGVDFVVCNTDSQALDISPVPVKIQLGESLTKEEVPDRYRMLVKTLRSKYRGHQDDFSQQYEDGVCTAGMGGEQHRRSSRNCKGGKRPWDTDCGIVTVPFSFEGRKRKSQAQKGIEAIRDAVDTLLVIDNDRLREMFGNLTLQNAFSQADDVLSTAAKELQK